MGPFCIVVGDVLRHGPSEVLLANQKASVRFDLEWSSLARGFATLTG